MSAVSFLYAFSIVGEPTNPEGWRWFCEVIGGNKAPILDTWWQPREGDQKWEEGRGWLKLICGSDWAEGRNFPPRRLDTASLKHSEASRELQAFHAPDQSGRRICW